MILAINRFVSGEVYDYSLQTVVLGAIIDP